MDARLEDYPSYASNASVLSKLKSGSAIGHGVRDLLKEAIDALCAKWQIKPHEINDEDTAPNKSKLRLESVPKLLTGRWLFAIRSGSKRTKE